MSAATAAPSQTSPPLPVSDRFTVVPKARDVSAALEAARTRARASGLPEEEWPALPDAAIRTYAALADHANNTTGLCWPEMETLAWILGKTLRTIQRHVHQLKEIGLVEIVERRRAQNGTFLGYKFRLPHIAAAAARIRERREANKVAYEERKRAHAEQREHRRKQSAARRQRVRKSPRTSEPVPISGEEGARRRRAGYEWFFDQPSSIKPPPASAPPPGSAGLAVEPASHGASSSASLPSPQPPDPSPAQTEPQISTPEHLSPPAETLSPTTGHECPVVPIYATTSDNDYPPQPPNGGPRDPKNTDQYHSLETPAVADSGQDPPGDDGETTPKANQDSFDHSTTAELAWIAVATALLDAHPNLDARDLAFRSASLAASTLRVELRDAPITTWRGLRRVVVGRTADLTRSRHGEELQRLWRELAGDPHSILEILP